MQSADTPFKATRREILIGAAGAALSLPVGSLTSPAAAAVPAAQAGPRPGSTFETKDGAAIFYKDWGTGSPVVFSHGWPLTADVWDAQMLFLGQRGNRVIAHDRRGHGRSEQTWHGNDMDTYADDLAALLDHLDVRGATLVGHSTGGGEVARYIGRHGTARVAKVVLISSVTPHLARSGTNPEGAPMSVFDGLRTGVVADRSQFLRDLALPFFGYNRPNAKTSQGQVESFWRQGIGGGIKNEYDSIKAFSETDFTGDLKRISVPCLVLQGDDDQIVPVQLASMRAIEIVPKGTLKIYQGAPHGLYVTHAEQVNADLLAFIKR